MVIALNKTIGAIDLVPAWLDSKGKIIDIKGFSHISIPIISGILSILANYSPKAHLYLPGIGTIGEVSTGNYSDEGITPAVQDGIVQQITDASGNINATGSGATRPLLIRGMYNKLYASADFDNTTYAAWSLNSGNTVAAGILDPFGGNSAKRITCTSAFTPVTLNQGTIGSGGPMNVPYTTAIWIRRNSGSGTIQMAGSDVYAGIDPTSTWQIITLTQTDTNDTDLSFQFRMFTPGDSVDVHSVGGFKGVWTGTQIIANGGIPITGMAASSNATGNYSWYFDEVDDSLTRTFPAGYESATVINAVQSGQVTLTAQNIVGAYPINASTFGQIVIAPSASITLEDLTALQAYANSLVNL